MIKKVFLLLIVCCLLTNNAKAMLRSAKSILGSSMRSMKLLSKAHAVKNSTRKYHYSEKERRELCLSPLSWKEKLIYKIQDGAGLYLASTAGAGVVGISACAIGAAKDLIADDKNDPHKFAKKYGKVGATIGYFGTGLWAAHKLYLFPELISMHAISGSALMIGKKYKNKQIAQQSV
jgi:hypothetical protein